MSYLVLARKYRPTSFLEVSGQDHVTKTLSNGIERGKIAHAFLFSGPRGVGKTSVARILSKALNCKKGPTPAPCRECANCIEITEGSSLAVREIDGASHNSVDNVRDLIDSFRTLPAPGYRYKVYIIDEVHMLSTSAFNALLKSLEEPPPNTVFILATTEAHKIPETVISRCQQHFFRALGVPAIEARLRQIAEKEHMKVEDSALRLIARQAAGSMRDAQSLLDKVQLFCEEKITGAEASKLLGAAEKSKLFELSDCILRKDATSCLKVLSDCFASGIDTALFLKDFVLHWRELLLAKFGGPKVLQETGVSEADSTELCKQVAVTSPADVHVLFTIAREGCDTALRSVFPKYVMEALIVRMALRDVVHEIKTSVPGSSQIGVAGESVIKSVAPQETPKASTAAKSVISVPRGTQSETSSWPEFVAFAGEKGSKFLAEQLKRVSCVSFANDLLHLRGPEFSINYISRDVEKEGLKKLLEQFSSRGAWHLKLECNGGANKEEDSSLLHAQKIEQRIRKVAREKDISEHPKIQKLKKAFPGSEIENIRIKEE